MDLNPKNTLTELVPYIHGAYNFTIFLLFLYQAGTGLKIRRERLHSTPPHFRSITRHRKLGPLLVLGGIFGFLAGLLMVYLEEGHVLEYPFHFAVGFLITLFLLFTFVVSQQIRGRESKFRTLHFIAGILILCFYSIQILLGLNMLF